MLATLVVLLVACVVLQLVTTVLLLRHLPTLILTLQIVVEQLQSVAARLAVMTDTLYDLRKPPYGPSGPIK